jgi:hypothetical protein
VQSKESAACSQRNWRRAVKELAACSENEPAACNEVKLQQSLK